MDLIHILTEQFNAYSNSEEAQKMSDYMKGKFFYFGIKAPVRSSIAKDWKMRYVNELGSDEKTELIRQLWKLPQREYKYTAVDLLNSRKKAEYRKEDYLLFEELITTDSWWDTVDLISSNAVGTYFQLFQEQIDPITKKWMKGVNFWLHRTCLLYQLKYKDRLDFDRLKSYIMEVKGNDEFFIQKAIGWSLRQHSKLNPQEVEEFIADGKIKGLALREASKYL